MIAQQQPVTIRPSLRAALDQSRGVRVVPGADTSFGTLLAAVGPAPVRLPPIAGLSLPKVRSSFSELDQSPRDRRLKTLGRESASSRNADSRIAGATRAARDHAVQAAGRAAGGSAAGVAARATETVSGASGSTAPQPSRSQEGVALRAATDGQGALSDPRAAASQSVARSGSIGAGNAPFEKGADAPGQTMAPSGSSRGMQPPAASPAAIESPRASQAAPARSASNVVRGVTAATPARGGSGQPAPNGAQQSGDQASQARGKVGDVLARTLESAAKAADAGRADQRGPRPGELIERIARIVHARAGGKETVARIRLDPPELGRVRIGMRLHNETLQLRLAAETVDGRESLQSHISELRAVLEQQGIRVQRIDLPVPANGETPDPMLTGDAENSSTSQGDAHHAGQRGGDVPGLLDPSKGKSTADSVEENEQPRWPESNATPVGLDVRI